MGRSQAPDQAGRGPELRGCFPPACRPSTSAPFDYFYWDDFWCTAGLRSASELLAARPANGRRRAGPSRCRRAAGRTRSPRSASCRGGSAGDAIPAGPRRAIDAGVIGSLVACEPLRLLASDDRRIAATLDVVARAVQSRRRVLPGEQPHRARARPSRCRWPKSSSPRATAAPSIGWHGCSTPPPRPGPGPKPSIRSCRRVHGRRPPRAGGGGLPVVRAQHAGAGAARDGRDDVAWARAVLDVARRAGGAGLRGARRADPLRDDVVSPCGGTATARRCCGSSWPHDDVDGGAADRTGPRSRLVDDRTVGRGTAVGTRAREPCRDEQRASSARCATARGARRAQGRDRPRRAGRHPRLAGPRPDDPRRPSRRSTRRKSGGESGLGRATRRASGGRSASPTSPRRSRSSPTPTSRCCTSSTRSCELGLVDQDVALQMARVIGSSACADRVAKIDAIEHESTSPYLDDGTEPAVVRASFLTSVDAADPRVRVAAPPPGRGPAPDGARGGAAGSTQVRRRLRRPGRVHCALSQQVDEHELAAIVDRFEAIGLRRRRPPRRPGREDDRRRGDVRRRRRRRPRSRSRSRWPRPTADDESVRRAGRARLRARARAGRRLLRPDGEPRQPHRDIAYPGAVVVSADVHDALADDPDRWQSLRPRYLKDIGRVQLWAARREGDEFDTRRVRSSGLAAGAARFATR